MKSNDYEFSNYTSADVPEIVAIEHFLWGNDEESRSEYFKWKHQRNPLLKKPVGIVAKHEGKVVGFRGYVPSEWQIGDRKFKILLLSDTVVHPEHRGKGLFSSMTKIGMQMYCDEYRFFVAFTSNNMSTPGYLKLGWKPIAIKKYLRHLSLLGLARVKITGAGRTKLKLGQFGEFEVSDSIRPVDISNIDAINCYTENKLSLNKSPDFLEWKLSNPRAKYAYFYHLAESKIDAYVILRVGTSNAHVIDYGQGRDSLGVQKLISFIIKQRRLGSISFFNAGMPEELKPFLRKKCFYTFGQIDKIRHGKSYNLPILVRPTVENCVEDDWLIGDIDIRNIDNWHITEICFD